MAGKPETRGLAREAIGSARLTAFGGWVLFVIILASRTVTRSRVRCQRCRFATMSIWTSR